MTIEVEDKYFKKLENLEDGDIVIAINHSRKFINGWVPFLVYGKSCEGLSLVSFKTDSCSTNVLNLRLHLKYLESDELRFAKIDEDSLKGLLIEFKIKN